MARPKGITEKLQKLLSTIGLSVALKFMILVVIIQILIGTPFFITTFMLMRNTMTRQSQRELEAHSAMIAVIAGGDLAGNNYSHLKKTLKSFAVTESKKGVAYAGVYDGVGTLIMSTDPPASTKSFRQIRKEGNIIIVSNPITYRGQYLGRVDVLSNRSLITDDLLGVGRTMFMLSLLSILITTPWTMFWAYYWMINPLSKLARAAKQVSKGDLDIAPEVHATDEVGELAETFTEMARSLKERGEQLEKAHIRLKSNYTELEAAHQRLKELDELKSEFMAIASHELLTPISTVRAYAETLIAGRFGELTREQSKTIRTIERVVIRLSRIVDDFVDYTLLEKGQLKFGNQKVSLKTVLEQTVEEFKVVTEERALRVSIDIQKGLPTIKGDQYRLHQVFNNLLANAVKFTPDGGDLSIKTSSEDGVVRVSFSDTGIGISKKKFSQIFLPFEQVERSTKRRFKGAGLGLAISKRIMEAHGGDLTVTSQLGKGSTFTCVFPIK